MWLRIEFIPRLQPCAERVLVCSPYIDAFRFCDSFRQLFFHFCLCLAKDVLNQPFAGLFVISGCVSPLPASVLPLSNVAFSIRSFLCHVCASCSVVAQTTTTEQAQSLLIFSEDRNIFQLLLRLLKIPILCLLRRSFCVCQLHFSLSYPSLPSTPNVRKTVCA